MVSTTIEIDGLEDIVTTALDRLLGVIDPTIDKFQNITIEILSELENRIHVNISDTLYWLETNLFILLFAVILFFILILILLNLLDSLLIKYEFFPGERRFAGLAVSTAIFIWLFVAIILSTWPPTKKFNFQTLKYVVFEIMCAVALYLIVIWIRCCSIHHYNIRRYFTQTLFRFKANDNILIRGSHTRVHPEAQMEMPVRNGTNPSDQS